MGDHEFLEELFEPVGRVQIKRMFGGLGAFRDGLMFAVIVGDAIYLKADDETRPAFEAEGCAAFTVPRKTGTSVSLGYWRIPERLIDDPDEMRDWSLKAVAVARRADAAKSAKPRRRAKAMQKARDDL